MALNQAHYRVLRSQLRVVFFLSGLIVGSLFLSGCLPSKQSVRPDWISLPPTGQGVAVGAASYEIFGEIRARENAVGKALTSLALQKSGTVDLESRIKNRQILNRSGSGESFREFASVSTTAVIRGNEIPVNAKIKAFWKDKQGKRIWVLIIEE